METTDFDAARWIELPEDFQMEIFDWFPVEFVYMYRFVCKQWNDLLSSNYFITRWSEEPRNTKQPRLVLLDRNPKMPSMSFCFLTWTWIKSCFTLSFLEDWVPQTCTSQLGIHCIYSAGGLILVCPVFRNPLPGRLCNPYTRTFVEIPASSTDPYAECIVVNEKNNQASDSAYKVVVVGDGPPDADGLDRLVVEIYEPSQKKWNIAGYLPVDLLLSTENELAFCNGYFYCYWRMGEGDVTPCGIVGFTIPLEGNDSAVAPVLPVLLAPFPELMRNLDDEDLLSWSRIITCGSRLLFIVAKKMPDELVGGTGQEEPAVIIMWEFKIEDRSVLSSNPPSWKWVEIARIPSVCNELMNKVSSSLQWRCCIGVGDHVCFIASDQSSEMEVLDYNLVNNTWNWLPRCPSIHHCGREAACHRRVYETVAFQPSPYMKVE